MRWAKCYASWPSPRWRLICFPYAGAGAATFADWRLPDELAAEIWSVRLPGRENRYHEPPIRRLTPMVSLLAAELRQLFDVPFVFFGHSMGALLAFELARLLRRSGRPQPRHLFVSAHRSPDLDPWRRAISTLPDDAMLDRLDEMARPAVSVLHNRELFVALAPMMRADFELCETYAYRDDEPLDIPLTAFTAVDDPEVRMDEMRAWKRHSTAGFQLHTVTGGHLYPRDGASFLLGRIADQLGGGDHHEGRAARLHHRDGIVAAGG